MPKGCAESEIAVFTHNPTGPHPPRKRLHEQQATGYSIIRISRTRHVGLVAGRAGTPLVSGTVVRWPVQFHGRLMAPIWSPIDNVFACNGISLCVSTKSFLCCSSTRLHDVCGPRDTKLFMHSSWAPISRKPTYDAKREYIMREEQPRRILWGARSSAIGRLHKRGQSDFNPTVFQ
jgi:hypothetical protein